MHAKIQNDLMDLLESTTPVRRASCSISRILITTAKDWSVLIRAESYILFILKRCASSALLPGKESSCVLSAECSSPFIETGLFFRQITGSSVALSRLAAMLSKICSILARAEGLCGCQLPGLFSGPQQKCVATPQ